MLCVFQEDDDDEDIVLDRLNGATTPPPPGGCTSTNGRSGHLLNSLTFLNQGSLCKGAFSTDAQSRFASAVVDSVLGPPHLAGPTGRCPCISVVPGSNARGESRALEGCRVSSKSPSRSMTKLEANCVTPS